jgi:hypothetical protein
MNQFYIVDVWEDHVGCSNAYVVSTEDLAMAKAAKLRAANRYDTIQVRGPFTIDDGQDVIGDDDQIVFSDDSPKVWAKELRDGEGSLLTLPIATRCTSSRSVFSHSAVHTA